MRTRTARAAGAADRADGRARHEQLPPAHGVVAEVLVGGDEGAATDAHGPPASGHAADEAHPPAARGPNRCAERRTEVDPAVLATGKAIGGERERAQDRSLDRPLPGPGPGGGNERQERGKDERDELHAYDGTSAPARSRRPRACRHTAARVLLRPRFSAPAPSS